MKNLFFFLSSCAFAATHLTTAPGGNRAAQKPEPCTFDWLTEGCELYAKAASVINLPDGTVIFNPLPDIRKQMSGGFQSQFAEERRVENVKATLTNEMQEKLSDLQGRAGEILAKATPPPGGKPASARILQKLQLKPAFVELVFGSDTKVAEVTLPWPIDAPTKVEPKPIADVQAAFKRSFSKETIAQMLALAEESNQIKEEYGQKMRNVDGDGFNPTQEFKDKRRGRAKELFEKARTYAMSVIRQNKQDKDLTPEERSALRRLETVRYLGEDTPEARENPACQRGPNAFYSSIHHAFVLCEGMSVMPDAALIAVIAHEITHSMDPCTSQYEICSCHKHAIAALFLNGEPKKEVLQSRSHFELARELKQKQELSAATPFLGGQALMNFTESAVTFMKKKGALKTDAAAMRPEKYVLKDIVDCFKHEKGGKFKSEDARVIERKATEVAEHRESEYDAKKDEELKDVKATLSKFPECSYGGHSVLAEAVADWMGAKVEGRFLAETLKGKTVLTPLERLSMISPISSATACAGKLGFQLRPKDTHGAKLQGIQEDLRNMIDEHPGSKKRIEDIFLREPQIREALGCAPHPNACEIGKKM